MMATATAISTGMLSVEGVIEGVSSTVDQSQSGTCLAGLSITEIPLGYGIFCLTYDFTVACYLMISDTAWHESGKFDLYFWRHRL